MEFVATRRQLRGIAESLIAGPQYRAAGTIRLAVRPDGFVGVALALAVHGTDLVWQNGGAQLAGRPGELAAAAGVDYGPPEGVYEIVDPLAADAVLDIDPKAAELIHRSLRRWVCAETGSAGITSGAVARTLRRRGHR